jgi:hypothetical protein
MNGAGLRLHNAAIGADLAHVIEQRDGLVGHPHSGPLQTRDCRIESGADSRVQILQRKALRDAEAQPGERNAFHRREILAGHYRVGLGAGSDAAGQRTDRIQRRAERESTGCRHALPARLEADNAAEGCRDAHRAAGVATDGDFRHAVADRHRGA